MERKRLFEAGDTVADRTAVRQRWKRVEEVLAVGPRVHRGRRIGPHVGNVGVRHTAAGTPDFASTGTTDFPAARATGDGATASTGTAVDDAAAGAAATDAARTTRASAPRIANPIVVSENLRAATTATSGGNDDHGETDKPDFRFDTHDMDP